MPQSHPTTGPVQFLSPVRFFARKAEWSARRNFTSVLFSWSHQATGPVRLDAAVYLRFGWIIRMTPRVTRPVPYGPRPRIFNVLFISYVTRTGPVWDPQGCRTALLRARKGIDTTRIGKNPARASYFAVRDPYGPVRFTHGLFTGYLKSQNLYGARKLMPQSHHTPGPRTDCSRAVHRLFWTKIVRPLTGPARGPCGAVRILPSRTGPVEF